MLLTRTGGFDAVLVDMAQGEFGDLAGMLVHSAARIRNERRKPWAVAVIPDTFSGLPMVPLRCVRACSQDRPCVWRVR